MVREKANENNMATAENSRFAEVLKNFLDINNSGHSAYTKTIRQLDLVVYERIVHSDFVDPR